MPSLKPHINFHKRAHATEKMNRNNICFSTLFGYTISMVLKTTDRCWKTFGFGRYLLNALIGKPFLVFFNYFLFLLDNVFYKDYQKINLVKPVFITGHPRSGTTFLHRLLSQTEEFTCFEFWNTVFSSLVARKILSPIDRIIKNRSQDAVFVKESGHFISWNSIEEEEFLLLGCYNSPMASLFTGLAFGKEDFWDLFYFDEQPKILNNEIMKYFTGCLKRQVYYLGRKQILAKMPYAMLRFQSFIKAFPDAKFVYLIRSPLDVVPSYLSLIRAILDDLWGLGNIPPSLLELIYKRIYDQSIRYYQWVDELEDKGILNPNQFMTLPYNLLKTDLTKALSLFSEFTEIRFSDKLKNEILKLSKKQKTYQREHQNMALEDFGFSRDSVLQDFDFVFDKYGFDK